MGVIKKETYFITTPTPPSSTGHPSDHQPQNFSNFAVIGGELCIRHNSLFLRHNAEGGVVNPLSMGKGWCRTAPGYGLSPFHGKGSGGTTGGMGSSPPAEEWRRTATRWGVIKKRNIFYYHPHPAQFHWAPLRSSATKFFKFCGDWRGTLQLP